MIGQVDPLTATATLAPYLAGPGAAVLVLMLVLVGLYIIVVKHLVPLVGAMGKRHLDQIDALIANQRAESSAITKTLASIDRRLARLEDLTDANRIAPTPGAPSPDRLT
jgi:hypothetical protein